VVDFFDVFQSLPFAPALPSCQQTQSRLGRVLLASRLPIVEKLTEIPRHRRATVRRDLGLAESRNSILLGIVGALIGFEVLGRFCGLMLGILTCPMRLSGSRLLTVIS